MAPVSRMPDERRFFYHIVLEFATSMTGAIAIQNLLAGKLSAGVQVFRGLAPRPGADLKRRIEPELERLRRVHATEPPPGFAYSRRLFQSLHIDPTKHRPSSEALWRRLRDRNDFPAVHPAVDLTNLLSLSYQVSYGLYDLARVEPPVIIAQGTEGDRYQGIRKEILNLAGKIVLKDRQGAFGNPSADSLRTSTNAASRDILQVLFFHPGDPRQQEIMAATAAAFNEFFAMDESTSFFA